MAHAALQDNFKILSEAVIGEFHRKAPVAANRNSDIAALIFLTYRQNRFASRFLLCKLPAFHLHSHKILFRQGMRRHGLQIFLKSGDITFVPLDLCREILHQLVLQPVLLALVIRFQHLQPCHVHIQIHFLPDQRISRAERLDLRIGKGLLVHIVTGTNRGLAGHDLADEFLFVLQRLIEIGIEGSLCDVLKHLHLRVLVSLPDDTAIALCHIRRPPAHIQMVDCNQAILHVRPGSHLLGTAEEHSHLPGTDLGKEFFLLRLRVRFMDKGDFRFRYSCRHELRFDIIIDIERSVILGCGQIAEYQLRQSLIFPILPDLQYVIDTGIQLAARIIRKQGIHEPLIEADLPAVRSDLQHVVDGRIHISAVYLCRTFRQGCHHLLLDFRRLHHDRFKLGIRYRQFQLVTGLDIRHLFEHGHELRQVEELCKPRSCPVTGSLRGQLNGGCGLPKGGGPAVKMRHTLLLQRAVLEIPHDRIKLRHGIADRRAGGKNHTFASGDLVHVPAFHKHIRGLLCFRSGQAGHVPHLRVKKQVLEGMALIHIQPVYAQLLERNHIVLPVIIQQLIQPRLQRFPGLFHLLDGKVLTPAVFELTDSFRNLINLLPEKPLLPFR